jgi:ubiquitin carboxyl-terminal hydrolase 7
MVLDTDDYASLEKDQVTIINADPADAEADQLHDLPTADDYEAMKEMVLPPLPEEPRTLDDVVHTWSIEAWNSMSRKEHGPVFRAGGYPWYVFLPSLPRLDEAKEGRLRFGDQISFPSKPPSSTGG